MRFRIPKDKGNLLPLCRRAGYIPQKSTERGEAAFIRPIHGEYPRFHLYISESASEFIFNLHLDQKKPTYGRETAHSGEYEGELVENEARRITELLAKLPIDLSESEKAASSEKRTLSAMFRKMLGS